MVVESFSCFLLSRFGEVANAFQIPNNTSTIINIRAPTFHTMVFRVCVDVSTLIANRTQDIGCPILYTILRAKLIQMDKLFCTQHLFKIQMERRATIKVLNNVL